MRIVLSNSSSSWGGIHKVTEILARGLIARGHDLRIMGARGKMLEERMRNVAPFDPIIGGMDFNPRSVWNASRAIGRHRAEIVLCLMKKDMTLTGIAAHLAGVPVVLRHGNQRALGRKPHVRLVFGRIPAMHVTNANATRELLLESSPWIAPDEVTTIYNGVNIDSFVNARPVDLGVPSGGLAIGFIGNFERRKGVLMLSAAWAEIAHAIPSAHLVLCGKGKLEPEMRALLATAPRVHWTGYRTDVPSVLKSLDLLVLPSFVEGAPNVVLEAMAARVPVVATRVSGTPELIRDGLEGRLIPAGDSNALKSSLMELSASPALRASLAKNAWRRVNDAFTIPRMIDEYETLFEALLERRGVRES